MNVRPFRGKVPVLGESVFIDETAVVIGDVELAGDVSVWPAVVIRGDIHSIRIGARSNIQDGSVLHVTHASKYHPEGFALNVGADVTVGHKVVLHGCEIGDRCLIGMGSVVMDGVVIEADVILGAGSLVPPGKHLEGGTLWLGSPVRRVRPLSEEELEYLAYSSARYVELKNAYLEEAAAAG
jgi:carbonic anhydrase/acetyltransferase-like protein (isoleucine patch superfamily)